MSRSTEVQTATAAGETEQERPFIPVKMAEDENGHAIVIREGSLEDIFGVKGPLANSKLLSDVVQFSATQHDLSAGEVDSLNQSLALIHGINPQDTIEAMLATQMAAVHDATIRHTRMMKSADTTDRLTLQERTVNKLTRTFVTQVEALRKYRNGGEQTMRVEHVTVNSGGQAIVGNVTQKAGGGGK